MHGKFTTGVVLAGASALLLAAGDARAQRAGENAVRAADDAFGTSVGNENIGLYSAYEVRGFSAIDAGNVRIDGLYFDQQVELIAHLAPSSAMRVGISAQGYPLPAPTGIVDYSLVRPGRERVVSAVAGYGPFGGSSFEIDAKGPLADGLSVALGGTWLHDANETGSMQRYWNLAATLRWKPSDAVEVLPFVSYSVNRDTEAQPLVFVAGPWLPPRVERGRFYGQSWTDSEGVGMNYGVVANAVLASGWTLKAGLFRSQIEQPASFADLFLDTTRDGLADHVIVADRDSRFASTSGEVRASRAFDAAGWRHTVHLVARARDQRRRYGGADAFDAGPARIGVPTVVEPPAFAFGPKTRDRVRQTTGAVAWQGRWGAALELGAGVQRSSYAKTVEEPGRVPTRGDDAPWLYDASVAWHVTPRLALYASRATGLEEGGVAPDNAANRSAAAPAIRTHQWDAGVRLALTPALTLITGVFDVRKPYYGLDASAVFRELGELQSRGLEASITGTLAPGLSLVAGTVLLRPRITGDEVAAGEIGRVPPGQTRRLTIGSVDWQLPWVKGLSLDATVTSVGSRMASRDNRVSVAARTVLDLGGRYAFHVGRAPASLRVNVGNALDNYGWRTNASSVFVYNAQRRYALTLAADF